MLKKNVLKPTEVDRRTSLLCAFDNRNEAPAGDSIVPEKMAWCISPARWTVNHVVETFPRETMQFGFPLLYNPAPCSLGSYHVAQFPADILSPTRSDRRDSPTALRARHAITLESRLA